MRSIITQSGRVVGVLALATMLFGVDGCKSTQDQTGKQTKADRSTTKSVKKALDEASVYKFPDVSASAYHGNVQLTGFVETADQRQQAAQIAAGVKGVHQVINEVIIKPTSATGRATIVDPQGRETGRMMLDTNAPPSTPNTSAPPSSTQPAPEGQDNPQQTNPQF